MIDSDSSCCVAVSASLFSRAVIAAFNVCTSFANLLFSRCRPSLSCLTSSWCCKSVEVAVVLDSKSVTIDWRFSNSAVSDKHFNCDSSACASNAARSSLRAWIRLDAFSSWSAIVAVNSSTVSWTDSYFVVTALKSRREVSLLLFWNSKALKAAASSSLTPASLFSLRAAAAWESLTAVSRSSIRSLKEPDSSAFCFSNWAISSSSYSFCISTAAPLRSSISFFESFWASFKSFTAADFASMADSRAAWNSLASMSDCSLLVLRSFLSRLTSVFKESTSVLDDSACKFVEIG